MFWMVGIGQAFGIWIRHNGMGRFGLAYGRHSMFGILFSKIHVSVYDEQKAFIIKRITC